MGGSSWRRSASLSILPSRRGSLSLSRACHFVSARVILTKGHRLPAEFWRILHAEYGIIVYPSALTEPVDTHGLNTDRTFTDCYQGHIGT